MKITRFALGLKCGDFAASVLEDVQTVRTHRVPFDLRYFSPLGFAARFRAEYLDQRGLFATGPGNEKFWVVDAGFGYRLPRHYGRLTFEVKNLTDAHFNYQDTDPGNPVVRVGRIALLKFTVGL